MHLRVAVLACAMASSASWAQTPTPSEEADGRVHVTLTLDAQSVSLAYAPDLDSSDAGLRALERTPGAPAIRLGELEGHRALRIGNLAPVEPAPDETSDPAAAARGEDAPSSAPDRRYTVWLMRDGAGWELEARPAGEGANDEPAGRIPLAHRESTDDAGGFSASLHATGAETGRLGLRWGPHRWSTDLRFDELPAPPPRPRVSGRGQAREADTDTSQFSRGTTLAERNESALVLPDGARIAALYWKGIDVEDEDFAALDETPDGSVVRLVRAPPLRVKSDVELRFGSARVPTGNLAPGFAGAYAVWLRRSDDGWRFVFNDEADSWGTQYDPSFDAAEIPVSYVRTTEAFRPLALIVSPTGPDQGRLVVHWGPHEWTADFSVAR